jgi:hypothetical protein
LYEPRYCKYDQIAVKEAPEGKTIIGNDFSEIAEEGKRYIHLSTRGPAGQSSCGRRILYESEVEPLTHAEEA